MSHIRMSVEEYAARQAKNSRARTDTPARERAPQVDGRSMRHEPCSVEPPETPALQGQQRETGRDQQRSITLTLPYPLSSNRYWRSFIPKKKDGTVGGNGRAVVTLSREAEAYKTKVRSIAIGSGVTAPIRGRVLLEVKLYPARPDDWIRRAQRNPDGWDNDVRCVDLDNALKVTIDALKGSVIEDDRWVFRLVADRMEPDGEARMIITVVPIVVVPTQQALI